MIKRFILIFIGAGLLACSSVTHVFFHPSQVKIGSSCITNQHIDSLVQPYKDSLAKEMNLIIGKASINFVTARPNGTMNNWFADAIFTNQTENVRLSEPVMCLFNVGGIRSSFNKGPITVGDVFKVMPFDNELVWVKLPIAALKDIEAYLIKSGGEPISNAQIVNGKLQLAGVNSQTQFFWVITSDYLVNGGDNMRFFSQKIAVNTTSKLLRNALLEEVKKQGELKIDTTIRVTF
ncbi:MAG: 5'-nucleotidase C-terminal domain-containing protein [Crocinitomicaceae bacterium]|nr:5'-nucleotidase C-terminal domain-containing protein [Crocinitomicaceae bacterium]